MAAVKVSQPANVPVRAQQTSKSEIRFEWLDSPTEEDVRRLAHVCSKAFENDANQLYYGGFPRSRDPEISEAIWRAWIRRENGRLATDAERRCMRFRYAPGVSKHSRDDVTSTSDDADWAILRENVDFQWVDGISKEVAAILGPALQRQYGDEVDRVTWRSSVMAVDPDLQGHGYGKGLNDFLVREVQKSGSPWFFTCLEHTRSFFERGGAHRVEKLIYHSKERLPAWRGIDEDGKRVVFNLMEVPPA